MLPPTVRMYRNDTAMTMMKVRTDSAEPSPISRLSVSSWCAISDSVVVPSSHA
jgi:hypothetical protein